MQFPKHYPDIPKWKWGLKYGIKDLKNLINSEEYKIFKEEDDKLIKEEELKYRKPIPKISQKKKERIKKEWSEADLFREIWWEREHICEICWKFIPEPRPECFSHVLSKGRYPALRYMKSNVSIVCNSDCHKENDRRNAWNDIELIKMILW